MAKKEIVQGDVLTFIAADNKYKAILCTHVYKEKSPNHYTFAALTYDSEQRPTIEDIINSKFFGVGNSAGNYWGFSEQALQKMWTYHPEIKPCSLGIYGFTIWRKDLIAFLGRLQLVGNLTILDNLLQNGNGGVNASSWEFLQRFFNAEMNEVLLRRGQKAFKVSTIIA